MKVAICCSTKYREKIGQVINILKENGIKPLFPDGKTIARKLNESDYVAALAREQYAALEESDAVYFIVPDGYMGTSVKLELGYATALKKPIFYSELTGDLALDHYPVKIIPIENIATLSTFIK